MKYFQIEEFNCQETGNNQMDKQFLLLLDTLRHKCGFPFVITSGYRDPTHSIEAKKEKPGKHSEGIACDIQVKNGAERFTLIDEALCLGFTGIGIHKDFIHVDTRKTTPVVWVY